MSFLIENDLNANFTPVASARTLNTDFQPSATRPTLVIYTVRIAGALTANQTTGNVQLRSDAAATPTTVRCQARMDFKVTGALTTMTIANDYVLSYLVPAGHFVRLGSTTEAGVVTFTRIAEVEIVL